MLYVIGQVASAQYVSTPQEMLYQDTFDPFSTGAVDTGFLPDPGDAISVRFHITPSGGLVTEMEAESQLMWPTAFQHQTSAIPGEGVFGIDADVDIAFEVKLDVAGVYQDTLPLWTEHLGLSHTTRFDTLVLPGSSEYPVTVGAQAALVEPFDYTVSLVTGVGLAFQVDVEPMLTGTLAGRHVETDLAGSIGIQDQETGTASLDLPAGSPGEVLLGSTYVADLGGLLTLNIVPSATLETFIGDFELVAFDIPITLLDISQERRFDTVAVAHPLPAMEPFEVDDFGRVEVGNLANRNIPLVNLGVLGLEGVARIEGSDAYSVYPEYFYASATQSDGVVVTFAPPAAGGFGATLVIESNDPTTPELRIPLSGTGFEEPEPEPPEPEPEPEPEPPPQDNLSGEEVKGCGCDGSAGVHVGFWAVLERLFARR